jgi:predicted Ser/Thr protein kinase
MPFCYLLTNKDEGPDRLFSGVLKHLNLYYESDGSLEGIFNVCKNVVEEMCAKMPPARKEAVKILFIEGNIGAGKSTLIKKLSKNKSKLPPVLQKNFEDPFILDEPLFCWQKLIYLGENEESPDHGKNILELFYAKTNKPNKTKIAFVFELIALMSRTISLLKYLTSSDRTAFISERSVFSDRLHFFYLVYF